MRITDEGVTDEKLGTNPLEHTVTSLGNIDPSDKVKSEKKTVLSEGECKLPNRGKCDLESKSKLKLEESDGNWVTSKGTIVDHDKPTS